MDLTTQKYFFEKKVLILDGSAPVRTLIKKTLVKLGCSSDCILATGQFRAALKYVRKEKPTVIFTDLVLDHRSGLELIHELSKYVESNMDRMFIVITSNADETAVAEAAEEDVDGYVLKPFSGKYLESYIRKVMNLKLNPTEFMAAVEMGKKSYFDGDYQMAHNILKEAKNLSDTPAIACYYLGETFRAVDRTPDALKEYDEGLGYNDIHYRCLVGKFEALDEINKKKEAYDVVKVLTKYFPVSPQRLGKIFKLAVYTQNFADADLYYELYQRIDIHSPELQNIVSAALFVSGKFHLQNEDSQKAVDAFEKSIMTSRLDPNLIEKCFMSLLDYKLDEDAEKVMDLYPSDLREDIVYQQMKYHLLYTNKKVDASLKIGTELIRRDQATALICKRVARDLFKKNKLKQSENICYTALEKYPDQKNDFKRLIDRIEKQKLK